MGMIEKRYHTSINVTQPENYFEKWYADVWRRRIGAESVAGVLLRNIIYEEIEKVGATIDSCGSDGRYCVRFDDERNYTLFVLKWT
jgi:hypothetical protein